MSKEQESGCQRPVGAAAAAGGARTAQPAGPAPAASPALAAQPASPVRATTREDALYLMHLIACSLRGRAPQPLPNGADWGRVYRLAAANSVEAMAGLAASQAPGIPPNLEKRLRADVDAALWRRLQFDAEREAIFRDLAAVGLSYLPMKGAIVAGYYPRPDMRSMADNDFLYGFVEPLPAAERESLGLEPNGDEGFRVCGSNEAERAETVERGTRTIERIMIARGYEAHRLRVGNADSFLKPPLFNFEAHRVLMEPPLSMAAYYRNPWARAVRSEEDPFLYKFRDEDEYVYLLAHAFKHFDMAGCGVRYVVDLRVFIDMKGAGMDWDYVRGELQELGLGEFEARSRSLADAAFGVGAAEGGALPGLSADDEELLHYLLASGTYGTGAQRFDKAMQKQLDEHGGNMRSAKLGYLWSRINSRSGVEFMFPRASRVRVLYPLLWVVRLVVMTVKRPGKWIGELRRLRDVDSA